MMITGHTADSICKAKVSLNLNLPHIACLTLLNILYFSTQTLLEF